MWDLTVGSTIFKSDGRYTVEKLKGYGAGFAGFGAWGQDAATTKLLKAFANQLANPEL